MSTEIQNTEAGMVRSDPFLEMIERAAEKSDIATVERLFELRAREQVRFDEQEFNAAMTRVQKEIRNVAPDLHNNQTKSDYASYDAMDRKIRPVYSKEGFALSFDTDESPFPEHVRAVCYVTRGAYTRTYKIDMPADGKGAKGGDVMTKTHARAAAMSYGMRYILKNIFAIAIGEDDRDGNLPPEFISEEEAKYIHDRLAAEGIALEPFLKAAKVDSVEHILAQNYVHVVRKMDERKARLAKEEAPA